MSGLSRTPGKRVWANPHRGFESRPLRHLSDRNGRHSALFVRLPPASPPCGLELLVFCVRLRSLEAGVSYG